MKKITKHPISSLVVSLLLSLVFALPCFASTIKINLNGKPLATSISPVIKNNTTLVPLRIVSENLGANVNYDPKTAAISITSNSDLITLYLGKTNATMNQKQFSLPVAPELIQNTTMVPLRFVSEQLKCNVNWDPKTQTINLANQNTSANKLPVATLKVKDYGTVQLELYPSLAPNTVNNFIALANNKYYDGLIFHRIIQNFMIQGGDPTGTGMGGPGYTIAGEFSDNGFDANTLLHTKGVISMARSYDPNSAGSQFFIMSSVSPHLDGQYAAFGKVISGLELIDQLEKVATDANDRPLTNVVIESIRVDTKGVNYPAPTKLSK